MLTFLSSVCSLTRSSCGLMDRALDLKPEVTQSCGFKSRLWQEVSTRKSPKALEQGTEPPTAPQVLQCWLPTTPLGWVKCREYISLLNILCIIVYVTNKAHLSLICIVSFRAVAAADLLKRDQGKLIFSLNHKNCPFIYM